MDIQILDLIDVVIVAALLWAGIVWLRRTRARLAMLGIGIIGGVYLVASRLGLQLTAWILQGFVAVFVFVVVVVFQDDLRRLFEQIAAKTPQAELHVINGAGHYLFRERPQAFNRALRSFCLG